MSGIGLLNEKALHASLKQWYARQGDRFEVPVSRFVIDIVRDDLLIENMDQRLFKEPAGWLGFLPEGLESFTTEDLAAAMGTRRDLAQKMAYCLREGRVIELIGKRGRAHLYRARPYRRL